MIHNGKKHKVLRSKAKVWGSGGEAPSRRRQLRVWGRSLQCLSL